MIEGGVQSALLLCNYPSLTADISLKVNRIQLNVSNIVNETNSILAGS